MFTPWPAKSFLRKHEYRAKFYGKSFIMGFIEGSSAPERITRPPFLTREAHAQHELSWVVGKCVARSMGCKLYANEVRLRLTFKLLSIFS